MRPAVTPEANAPTLAPKLWYTMPAYARDGKVVRFFQCAQKFNTRYATLGFSDSAHLDDGDMWPVAYAVKELTAVEEERIGALVKKAAGPKASLERRALNGAGCGSECTLSV